MRSDNASVDPVPPPNGEDRARPRVSVCMPVYNSENTIDTAIGSVLRQTYTDFECVVVDNASTDSTVARVEKYDDPRIRIVRNDENVGPLRNHNRCIEHAHGDLIQFLHGDDRLLPDCLSRLAPTFDRSSVGLAFAPRRIECSDPGLVALLSDLHRPLEPLQDVNDGIAIVRKWVHSGSTGNWFGEPTSVMIRRSVLNEVGGFDPEQRYGSDIDLWIRILARSDAAWVDRELSVRVHHDETLTTLYSNTDEAWLDREWTLCRLAHSRDLDRNLRATLWRQWGIAIGKKCIRASVSPKSLRRSKFQQLNRHVHLALGNRGFRDATKLDTSSPSPSLHRRTAR